MKTKTLALVLTLMGTPCFGGFKQGEIPKQPFSSLKLDQETYISDTNGVLNPKMLIGLVPSNLIKVYLTDGTVFTGLVKETEIFNNEIFKVFGEITNKKNTGFGFVLTKDGVFAGAIVYRDTEETFEVKYSEELQAYILVKKIEKKFKPSFFRK